MSGRGGIERKDGKYILEGWVESALEKNLSTSASRGRGGGNWR